MTSLITNLPPNETSTFWKTIKCPLVLAGKKTAPRMYMRSGLIRKDLLPKYCEALMSVDQQAVVVGSGSGCDMPQTWVVANFPEVEQFICSNPQPGKYVVKYSDSSNAYGLILLDLSSQVSRAKGLELLRENFLADSSSLRVIQHYVPPYLIDDRNGNGDKDNNNDKKKHKFHLRVLVLCVGKLECFLYDEVRVLIAPEPYSSDISGEGGEAIGVEESREGGNTNKNSNSNSNSCNNLLHAHVTNQSYNKAHHSYNPKLHNIALHECSELNNGDDFAKNEKGLWTQMNEILKRTFRKLGGDGRKFLALPTTYELFGESGRARDPWRWFAN